MDVGNAIATAVDLSISAAAFGGLALMTIQALRVTNVIPASALDARVSLPVWKAVAAAAVVAYVGGYACDVIDAEEGWEDEDSGNEDEDDFDSDGESEEEEEFVHLTPVQKAALRGASKAMAEQFPDAECKMVILVRKDLKMNAGKIAAQCGHAVLGCYRLARVHQPEMVRQWFRRGQAKVALKVDSEATMDSIMRAAWENGLTAVPIRDAGHTQVAAGSKTVLGIGPAPKKVIDLFTGQLKLL
eukprot:m.458274 g.458274  ORF g.458274 m.458274 type:complete len:244 (+) comp21459_c0_seq1:199-930(+)